MSPNETFSQFVLDQLPESGDFETKKMFGGLALLDQGSAFAKIKHEKLWLKVDDSNRADFEAADMPQYSYGKDNSRKLNFYQVPLEVVEDRDQLAEWVTKARAVISGSKK